MMDDRLEERARALRAGTITADEFLRATAQRWRMMARAAFRRWGRKLPDWVELADLEQEAMMLALDKVAQWDASRGSGIAGYVVWSTTMRLNRKIHGMRGANIHGNAGKNPSRFEKNFSKMSSVRRGGEKEGSAFGPRREFTPDFVPVRAAQEDIAAAREALSAEGPAAELSERVVLAALLESDGVPNEAALKIFASFAARVSCGTQNWEAVEELVDGVVRKLDRNEARAA
jgi:hypothetical protein